jgi:glycosyltransferase involved in cell wall biosynthesis
VEPLVLHVLPLDVARGAQTYARDLRRRLDGRTGCHRTLTLFRSDADTLQADLALDVPNGGLRRAGFDPRAVTRLRRALQRDAPAVVVAHGGEPLKYLALAGVERDRLVYYKIGTNDPRLRGIKRALHRVAQRRAGVVATVSAAAAEEAIALGVPAERVVVIPNGRDPDEFTAAARVESNVVRLVTVGRLDPTKRPRRFVDVVSALRGEGRAVDGSIAGAGPMLEELRPVADAQRVALLGEVDDVPALLAASDIFVFTGAPPEGMPGVLIEAGLSGLPVVTTDVPGAADVVEDGRTGFVVPVDDFDGLVRATRALVDDADLRRRFGEAARARCVERFTFDATLRLWDDVLRDILAKQCTSST